MNGREWDNGNGIFVEGDVRIDAASDASSSWLRFELSREAPESSTQRGREVLISREIELTSGPVLLRLDEVSFPPAACAYRHVHPGPGVRYLTMGALHLQGDHHEEHARPGHAWFEAANAPVKATAGPDCPKTNFVRFMALPADYAGKSTIRFLDRADAERPRLQTTRWHFDHIVDPGQG